MLHDILYITKLPGTFYNIKHIYFYRKRASNNAEGQNVSNRSTGDTNIDILCTDFAIFSCFCNYIHIKIIFFKKRENWSLPSSAASKRLFHSSLCRLTPSRKFTPFFHLV